MKTTYAREEAERLLPLLRSIGREIRFRSGEATRLQNRIAALFPTRHVHGEELRRLEAELATQRRELRLSERELARLGCRLDRRAVAKILIPAGREDHVVEGFLAQTRFTPAPLAS